MSLTVNPSQLQADSRALRRSATNIRLAPTDVRGALNAVADHCGDGVCAADARALGGAWNVAIAGLNTGAGNLAAATQSAGDNYSMTENVVFTGMTGSAS
ncbi:hypothetical protein [Calidifontibacter terrae]